MKEWVARIVSPELRWGPAARKVETLTIRIVAKHRRAVAHALCDIVPEVVARGRPDISSYEVAMRDRPQDSVFLQDAAASVPSTIPISHVRKLTGLRQSQLDQLIYERILETVSYGRRLRVTVASLLAYAADPNAFEFEDWETVVP